KGIRIEQGKKLNTIKIKTLNYKQSSIKSKRVIRSSLALEIYSIVASINIGIVLGATLKQITKELGIPLIKTVVYTNSFSLYKYLVKLRTTKEKRLIINIIGFKDNPLDAIIKGNPNWTLKMLININSLTIQVEG
ncbi:hypothetical protein LCER1_G007637, partial [Lachnellula cervina]